MINLSKFYKKIKSPIGGDKEQLLFASLCQFNKINNRSMKSADLDYILNEINELLNIRLSFYPLDIIGCLYIMGTISADQIINIILAKGGDQELLEKITAAKLSLLDPRNIIISKIVDCLYEYKNLVKVIPTSDELIDMAKNIEKSCYNATILNCRKSDNPPPRNWESSEFIEVYYSSRCGSIIRLLSPTSQSAKEYGSILFYKLLNKEIDADKIGFMSESEICPISQEKERILLQMRMDQKIEEKFSDLYQCPACKERKTTYITKQLRALDEAADIICTCINCNHNFRVR
jgi:DNA-directed RNA polymerase subunit M/transcription elongation factor TFIIS